MMDPMRFKYLTIHKMDGPHKGSKFISTKWTSPRGNTIRPVHKVDGHIFQQMHGPLDEFDIQHILRVNGPQ